jgi:ribosomal protein S17E
MTATKGNKGSSIDGQKMITVYVGRDLARAFKIRVEEVGLDVSKVVRNLMAGYLSMSQAEVGRSAAEIRRMELEAQVIEAARAYASKYRDQKEALALGETLFHLDPGTLLALIRD